MLYTHILRPLLFYATRRDPELAHTVAVRLLAALSHAPVLLEQVRHTWAVHDPALAREVFGVRFPNPVGLAAGYDKDGLALPALAALGFGHIEVGTVTWHGQPGNPRPRVFRLAESGALINRMGFNNQGAPALAARLRTLPPLPIPIGISLGKSRRTPLEAAVDDYCSSLRILYPYGDYFAINISSPNTPGLRSLQARDQLEALLAALQREASSVIRAASPVLRHSASEMVPPSVATDDAARIPNDAARMTQPKPLLVKISPDLTDAAILEVLEVCAAHNVSGIIATNTTLSRAGLRETINEEGGLSGRPLFATARRIIQFISHETGGRLPIIGVGGIFSPDDARHMLDAGASLVQVYTGFIYAGPELVRSINRALHRS